MSNVSPDTYSMGYDDGLGDADTKLEEASKLLKEATDRINQVNSGNPVPPAPTPDEKRKLRRLSLASIVLAIPYAIFQGFVMTELWGWFVLPNFIGAPHLTILDFMGLVLIPSIVFLGLYLRPIVHANAAKRIEHETTLLFGYPFIYSLILLMGFIYHIV